MPSLDIRILLEAIGSPRVPVIGSVTQVTSDSRLVNRTSIFVAIEGSTKDGHDFLDEVFKKGALLVIGQKDLKPSGGAYLRVRDSRIALARLATRLFGNPTRDLKVVGITGTSGKTTTSYLVESILKVAGYDVGVIGTVNFRQGTRVWPSSHTTPGVVELNELISDMKSNGATAIVMEVSSHALKQRRVEGVAFDAVVFKNLSREHLDFHPDLEDYFNSKAILFRDCLDYSTTMGKNPCAVINEEDAHGRRLLVEMKPKSARVLSYSIANQAIQIGLSGLKGTFDGIEFESKLVGSFNASNILAAISVGRGLGLSDEVISRGIQNLESVPGRLERIPNSLGINALVDYAHKPDALEKVLKTLKSAKGKNRLITIFGCGGDRDRLKRPLMGRIAVENSDCVVITSDNPRTEDPAQIIEEILKGIPEGSGNFEVVPDRRGAIFRGIDLAAPGDVVVVAGKGHEDYQIIKTPQGTPQKIEFDDRKVTAEALAFKTQSI